MNRRGFLQAMLAASVAPAVVKAENIMKIWTPPQEILTPIITVNDNFNGKDFTIETWLYPAALNTWSHVAMTRENGVLKRWVNGVEVKSYPAELALSLAPESRDVTLQTGPFNGYLQDLKIIKDKALEVRFEPHSVALQNNVMPLHFSNDTKLIVGRPK